MKNLKLQSAMEYLMTYGWAILIIAVVMVALFSLGILGGSPLSTTCLPGSGYECTAVTYNHGTVGGGWPWPGNVIVTIGQTTGTNWATANIFFVAQGTSTNAGVPSSIPVGVASAEPLGGTGNTIGYTAGGVTVGTGLITGQTSQVALGVPGSSVVSVGGTATGTVWAQYTLTTGGPLYYAQIGTLTLKAV